MIYIILLIIATVVFLYNSWKGLHEDCGSQNTIGFSWVLVLVIILVARMFGGGWKSDGPWWQILAIWKYLKMNYFVGLIAGVLTTIMIANQKKWKAWLILEDLTPGFLLFLLIMYLNNIIGKFDLAELIKFGIVFFAYFWQKHLVKRYRSFVWYKSGKKGFVFFAVSTVVLFLMALNAFFLQNGTFQAFSYLGGSLLSLSGLYILGKV